MKKILSFSIDFLIGFTIYGQTCVYKPASPYENGQCLKGDWTLVFEDEFEGNQIDNNK